MYYKTDFPNGTNIAFSSPIYLNEAENIDGVMDEAKKQDELMDEAMKGWKKFIDLPRPDDNTKKEATSKKRKWFDRLF